MSTDAATQVPGQVVLPGMATEVGYEAITLKPVEERFCWEYVLRRDNATRAYMVARQETDQVKARKNGSKLLQKSDIRRRIEEIRKELKRKYTVTAEDIVEYHSKVMNISRDEFVGLDGKPKKLADIDPEALSILEFECEKDAKGNVFVLFKVPHRHQSAVELTRIMGLYKDGLNLTGGMKMEHAMGVTDDAERFEALRNKLSGMRRGETDTSR